MPLEPNTIQNMVSAHASSVYCAAPAKGYETGKGDATSETFWNRRRTCLSLFIFCCFFKCSLFIQLLLLLSSRETPIPWRAPPTTCRGFPKLRRHRSCSGRVPHTIWRRRRWRPGVTRDLSPEKLRFHRGKPSHVVRISPCFFRISLSKIGKFEGIWVIWYFIG